MKEKSSLYVVSLPIGNISDISLRALAVLHSVDVIVCENVAQTTSLLRHLGILNQVYPKKQKTQDKIQEKSKLFLNQLQPLIKRPDKPHFIAYESYTHSAHLVQDVITLMKSKKISVALVSTAGTPLLSDPGLDLIRAAQEENITIQPIPGPSALLSGLVISGFNSNYFAFIGMLPKNQNKRKKLLKDWLEIKLRKTTFIAYIAKYQLLSTLKDLLEILGDEKIFLANDLTKMNEQGYLGKISNLIKYLDENKTKGEWLVIFSSKNANLNKEPKLKE